MTEITRSKAYSRLFWGILFLIPAVRIDFILSGMSTRIIGLLFLSVAAQIFLTQEDGEIYFAQMKTRCGQGMIFWLGMVGYYNLVIVGTVPNLWIFEILENGIWYLFLIGICENLFCAMEDVKGTNLLRGWKKGFPVGMLVLSMVGFAGIFTGWIFLRLFELLGQVIVLIWMLNQITELKRTPDKQDMEEMLRSHTGKPTERSAPPKI